MAVNVTSILRNKTFMRLLLQDSVEAHMTLQPIFCLLLESCEDPSEKTNEHDCSKSAASKDALIIELYIECIRIFSTVMALDYGRSFAPGYSLDKYKIRQKAIDAGVLIGVTHTMLYSKYPELVELINEEFIELIGEHDIAHHQKNSQGFYAFMNNLLLPGS